MKSCTFIVFSWAFFLALSASAQSIPNVSGKWNGTSSFQNRTLNVELQLKQKGNQLTGVFLQKSMKGKDSLKATYKGHLIEGMIRLVPESLEYGTGNLCTGNLKFEIKTPNKIVGTWKGDWKLITCIPGEVGPIVLMRKVEVDQ